MTTLSFHVLDLVLGRPAAGLGLRVALPDGGSVALTTDADGRARVPDEVTAGEGAVTFETGAWFDAQGRERFHPVVEVRFPVTAGEHHHIALVLSPFGYTTYRGS